MRAAIQAAEAELRLIGRAGGMPRRAVHVLAPLNGVIADFDGGVIRGLCDSAPRCCGQTVGVPVRPDICVCLHHQASRSIRHTMVLLGGGTPALAAGQLRAAGDAGDLLRGPHLRVVYLVVEGNRGLESVGVEADGDLLDSHLLAVLDGGSGDPVAGPVVHQRQAVRVGDEQRAGVLAAHTGRAGQCGLHERLGGGLVRDSTLRDIGFPATPRRGCRRIRLAED